MTALRVRASGQIFGMSLLAILTVAFWTVVEASPFLPQPPLEDAAMLFRYADILASGGGLAWNYGEHPGDTDGATDLGFVLVLAPIAALGISTTTAAWILNLTAIALLGALIGWLGRSFWKLPPQVTALLVILLMSGPVNRYLSGGFSPIIFGLYLSSLASITILAARTPNRPRRAWFALGLMVSGAGWWRPEGFALGSLILVGALAVAMHRHHVRLFIQRLDWLFIAVGTVFGFLFWVLFRLAYFGHLLPSSAVLKSGDLRVGNAIETLQFLTIALSPILVLATVWALSAPTRIWVLLTSLAASSIVWLPAVFHLNWWNRMQWPLVPALAVIAVSSVLGRSSPLPQMTRQSAPVRLTYLSLSLVLGMLVIAVLRVNVLPAPPYTRYEPHFSLSQSLRSTDTSGVRLATSEAGLVPLAISGQALDTYGFNNYAIAKSGGEALHAELNRLRPNLLITNGPVPRQLEGRLADPSCASNDPVAYLGPDWVQMHKVLVDFANKQGLNLVRSIETGECLAFSVYSSDEIPESVLRALRTFSSPNRDLI